MSPKLSYEASSGRRQYFLCFRLFHVIAILLLTCNLPGQMPSTVSVSISPATVTLNSAATQQFTAYVDGVKSTSVTWSCLRGTISSTGLFTAPTVSDTVVTHVRATLIGSQPKAGKATVTIVPGSGDGGGNPVQPSFFGMDINKYTSPWPTTLNVKFGAYRSLGSAIKWSDVNPAQHVYNWSSLDGWISTAQAAGQDVLYTVYYTPAWASSDPSGTCTSGHLDPGGCYPPNDLNDDGSGTNQHFQDFLTALMNHVGPGKIRYLEIWNEPNITTEWLGTNAQLVRMAKDAAAIAKTIDPQILLISPAETGDGKGGTSMNWLAGFLAAGGGQYVDIIGFHGYATNPEDVATRIDSTRTVMASYGQQDKPIFDTESSWGMNQLSDPDQQAAFTGRHYLVQIAKQIARTYWYGWDFASTGDFYSAGQLTKAGIAYQQIYQWMIDATPVGACSPNGSIWSCNFTRPNGYQAMAVWDTSQTCTNGLCTTRMYTVPTQFTQYRDLDGNLVGLTGTQVPLGLTPILLETHSAW
jgi:hypothetical protein